MKPIEDAIDPRENGQKTDSEKVLRTGAMSEPWWLNPSEPRSCSILRNVIAEIHS